MEKEIQENLTTKWLGKNLIYYANIDSTQNEIYRLIEKNKKLKNGTVVIADEQTDGIGTHGRKWHSGNKENILFSFIIYPDCSINKIKGFTIKIAECMVKVIKKVCDISLEIKQPNDLVYNGKKVGGILTQSITNKEKVKQIVIGIGLNVNGLIFPKELENIAISLRQIIKKKIPRENIIIEFLNLFEKDCFLTD